MVYLLIAMFLFGTPYGRSLVGAFFWGFEQAVAGDAKSLRRVIKKLRK